MKPRVPFSRIPRTAHVTCSLLSACAHTYVAQVLVETAMLAAVSGLAYLLSTLLRLDTTLGYFLPLPVVLASFRGGPGAGWRTMMATCFLLVGEPS